MTLVYQDSADWLLFDQFSEAVFMHPEHYHDRAELFYPKTGVTLVFSKGVPLIVPPHRALWIPAHTYHSFAFVSGTLQRSLFFPAEASKIVSTEIRVMEVTPLLRELIMGLFDSKFPMPVQKRMSRLILDILHEAPVTPNPLQLPPEGPLRTVAQSVMQDQRWTVPLEAICAEVHMTPKTFERHFLKATGMTFKAWRAAARLCLSLDLLASGIGIKQTALVQFIRNQNGYQNYSSRKITDYMKDIGCLTINEDKSNTVHLGKIKDGKRSLPRVLLIDVETLRDNAEKYELFAEQARE